MIGFDAPYFLLALALLYWIYKRGFSTLLLPFSPISWLGDGKVNRSWKLSCVRYSEFIFYGSLVLGLSEPYISVKRDSIKTEGIDLSITLDLSASMQAADFKPNRLEAMKTLVNEYLEDTRGNRTCVVVFSGQVYLHYPFSFNKNALQKAISSIHFQTFEHNRAGGTHIGDAILFSQEELSRLKAEGREQAIVLITDGENTGGLDPILAAKLALENGIHLYIIGMASADLIPVFEPDGDPYIGSDGKQLVTSLKDESLQAIADAAGGMYYRAKEGQSLKSILSEINALEKKPLEVSQVKEKISLNLVVTFIIFFSFCCYYLGASFWIRRPVR
ncbi:von Willebrand factor type A domain protein [Leptospira ryugenii]|uniref:von Willebrand factor type A domain protein n=1 Tax=Leptospira ryugenii TaxID=1917863 RepID=A0A2P2E1H0_9LEPT|nr:VWA domain-containing protein [Leptospira ryugenii]GBF50636.1 von Willebrand factor type A domain protein [Leptospira ryugenii]